MVGGSVVWFCCCCFLRSTFENRVSKIKINVWKLRKHGSEHCHFVAGNKCDVTNKAGMCHRSVHYVMLKLLCSFCSSSVKNEPTWQFPGGATNRSKISSSIDRMTGNTCTFSSFRANLRLRLEPPSMKESNSLLKFTDTGSLYSIV